MGRKMHFKGGTPPPGSPPWKKVHLKYSLDSPLSEYIYFKQESFINTVQIPSKKGLIWAKRGRKGGLSPPPAYLGIFFAPEIISRVSSIRKYVHFAKKIFF